MSYKSLYITLLFLPVWVSCVPKPPELPLAQDKLVAVLADIHVAEAALQNVSVHAKDSFANLYYEQIVAIHEVDRTLVDSSILLMRSYPDLMKEVYDKVLIRMDEINPKVDKDGVQLPENAAKGR